MKRIKVMFPMLQPKSRRSLSVTFHERADEQGKVTARPGGFDSPLAGGNSLAVGLEKTLRKLVVTPGAMFMINTSCAL
jgi:hypothetical protein